MSSNALRLRGAWYSLYSEQRLAVGAAAGLLLSMFLPWYQQSGFSTRPDGSVNELSDSFNAFQSWGFIEASILLVALAIIALCAARAERRAFHLPGGDGVILMAAGGWVMFLVFYRQLDRPSGNDAGVLRPVGSPSWSPVSVDWGIFVTFLVGAVIVFAGWRMYMRHRPEPLLDGDNPRTATVEGDPTSVAATAPQQQPPSTAATAPTPAPGDRPRAKPTVAPAPPEGQLSFEDANDQPAAD